MRIGYGIVGRVGLGIPFLKRKNFQLVRSEVQIERNLLARVGQENEHFGGQQSVHQHYLIKSLAGTAGGSGSKLLASRIVALLLRGCTR